MNLLNLLSSLLPKVVIQLIQIELNNFHYTFNEFLSRIIPLIKTLSECIENIRRCDWKCIIYNEVLFKFFVLDELENSFLKCLKIFCFFLLNLYLCVYSHSLGVLTDLKFLFYVQNLTVFRLTLLLLVSQFIGQILNLSLTMFQVFLEFVKVSYDFGYL